MSISRVRITWFFSSFITRLLAATEKGVGSVYLLAATEAITENPDVLAKLELPEGFKPIGSLGLGYAAVEMQPRELTFKIEMNSID